MLRWRPAAAFGGFEAGQTDVAVRVVALERPAEEGFEGFGGFEAGQTAVLNPMKNRWQGMLPWKGVRKGLKGLEGLKPGKRQS